MEEEVKSKSWFGRNWLWVVPVGGCLTLIVLAILGFGAIFFGVTKAMKGVEPYKHSVELATHDLHVIELLGEPVETDGIMQGNVSFKNDDGEADIRVPIKGSKGTGAIIVIGHKVNGEWIYEKLYVQIKETNEEINLLDNELDDF